MAKAIANKFLDKFISKKLFCLVVGISLELSSIGISDNLLYLMVAYIGGQAVVDSFLAFKNGKKQLDNSTSN
jgi:hypothetical protein